MTYGYNENATRETASRVYPWFALRVRSNFEFTVATQLQARGVEWYLPKYKTRRQWSDRIKEVDVPLFPGYIFCRLDLENRLTAVSTPGVVAIVSSGKTPVPVSEEEIASVERVMASGLLAGPCPYLRTGDWVIVEKGPLAGLEGLLVQVRNAYRVVVSVHLLQRSIAAEVNVEWVRLSRRGSAVVGVPQRRSA